MEKHRKSTDYQLPPYPSIFLLAECVPMGNDASHWLFAALLLCLVWPISENKTERIKEKNSLFNYIVAQKITYKQPWSHISLNNIDTIYMYEKEKKLDIISYTQICFMLKRQIIGPEKLCGSVDNFWVCTTFIVATTQFSSVQCSLNWVGIIIRKYNTTTNPCLITFPAVHFNLVTFCLEVQFRSKKSRKVK